MVHNLNFLYSVYGKIKAANIMQELKIKKNDLNLKIFIDDFPDLSLFPDSDLNLLISDLEIEISNCIEKKNNKINKIIVKEKNSVPP